MAELPSSEALLLRTVKRTHEMYLSNYGQRPAEHEPSQKLRAAIKTKGEYALVKDMPAPAAGKPTAAGVTVAAATATPAASALKSTAAAPLLLEQKGAKPAAAAGAKPSTAVVMHSARGDSTHIIPRRKLQRDLPKPEWHAPWKLMRVISGHLGWVRAMAVDPTNQWFVTGSADRTIKVWDLASGNLKLTLTGHISCIRGLAISSRSPYMFSAGEDKMVKCWDLEYNKVIRDYHGHLSGVYSLSLHPTLDLLVTGGRDSVARVWDVRTKACVHTLCGHTQTVGAVATQALEPQVITGSYDATVRLWDLVAGRASAVLTNHKKSVRAIALSPSEYTFATASTENIKKWKCPEGKFLHNMTGHNCIINSLCVNQDGVMASGGDAGSINMWDWKTGYNFQTLQTIAQPGSLDGERGIYSSMFDLSGSRLITGEADKTIKIWKEDADATEETHPVNFEPSSDRKRY